MLLSVVLNAVKDLLSSQIPGQKQIPRPLASE